MRMEFKGAKTSGAILPEGDDKEVVLWFETLSFFLSLFHLPKISIWKLEMFPQSADTEAFHTLETSDCRSSSRRLNFYNPAGI